MTDLPQWYAGAPSEPGLYITASTHPERKCVAQVAHWDGKLWQHWSGFYDHAITHWMDADFPEKLEPPHRAAESSRSVG